MDRGKVSVGFKFFEELSILELYKILQIRTQVFVVEQNCPYQECDGKDLQAQHALLNFENEIIGTARILMPDLDHFVLGRIVVDKTYRDFGLGRLLVKELVKHCIVECKAKVISMSAQVYLIDFYQSLGFNTVGDQYLEDDIPHIKMTMEV